MLGRVTFAALLLAAGGAAVLDGVGLVQMGVREYLALALAVIGTGLVVGAWVGRARWLIAIGLVLVPALLVAGLVQASVRDEGPMNRVERPFALSQVRPEYRQTAGQMTIDLSKVSFSPDATNVDASLGVGKLVVVVPRDVNVNVDAQVGAGSAELFGRGYGHDDRSGSVDSSGGVDKSGGDRNGPGVDETLTSSGTPDGGQLQLDLRAGLGEIVVRRAP